MENLIEQQIELLIIAPFLIVLDVRIMWTSFNELLEVIVQERHESVEDEVHVIVREEPRNQAADLNTFFVEETRDLLLLHDHIRRSRYHSLRTNMHFPQEVQQMRFQDTHALHTHTQTDIRIQKYINFSFDTHNAIPTDRSTESD